MRQYILSGSEVNKFLSVTTCCQKHHLVLLYLLSSGDNAPFLPFPGGLTAVINC
jgi:hypothetical protein